MDKKTQCQIRAAGIVQAVIASGAPPQQWAKLTQHGLRMSNYFAAKLNGEQATLPKYKESN